MNLKTFAWGFGIVFVLIGLLGFVPALNPGGLLLGIFQVNGFHNIVHILSGVVAVVAALGGAYYAKWYFIVFGVVYALVTVLGFLTGNGLFGLIPVNMADNLLHLVIAGSSLYLGFTAPKEVKKV